MEELAWHLQFISNNFFFLMQQVTLIQLGKQRGGLKCFPWSRRKYCQIIGIKDMHVLSPALFLKAEHNREQTLSFTYTHLNLTNKQETATRELLRTQDMGTETHLPFSLLVYYLRPLQACSSKLARLAIVLRWLSPTGQEHWGEQSPGRHNVIYWI